MASARRHFGVQASLFAPVRAAIPVESRGAVFTKRWVVDLVLDLAGYSADRNLVDARAIEPAAGEGAFLLPMAGHLVESCRRQGRPDIDCLHSLRAFELDPGTAQTARTAVRSRLVEMNVAEDDAGRIAQAWVVAGDFLHEAPNLDQADFIVGNPPYVRIEDLPGDVQSFYRAAYPTMKGRADLYVAFLSNPRCKGFWAG